MSGIKTELLLFGSVSPFQKLFIIVVSSINIGAKVCLTNVCVSLRWLKHSRNEGLFEAAYCFVWHVNQMKNRYAIGKDMTAEFKTRVK